MRGCVGEGKREQNFILHKSIVDAFIKTEHRTAVNGNLLSVMSQRKQKFVFSFRFLFESNYYHCTFFFAVRHPQRD
jgi:hypothetical protein